MTGCTGNCDQGRRACDCERLALNERIARRAQSATYFLIALASMAALFGVIA